MGAAGRVGRIAVVVLLAASGVVAFATMAPDAEHGIEPPKRPIIEALDLRLDAAPAPKSYFREEAFQRGDTVAAFLERQGYARVYNLTGGVDAWASEVDPAMPKY